MKRSVWFVVLVLLATVGGAQQNRISPIYKRDILDARTIAVVAYSSTAAGNAQENERSRLDVEQALRAWGRYEVVGDASATDLIILVRKGHAQAATIGGTGTPPVLVGPLDSGANISIHRGQNPPLSRTDPSSGGSSQPRLGAEAGSPDDLLEVYLGRTPLPGDASRNATQYPLDEPPVWSYAATDALKAPKIEAVAEFKKAVEAAEKKKP